MKSVIKKVLIFISFFLLLCLFVNTFSKQRFASSEPTDFFINDKKTEIENTQNLDSLKSIAKENLDYTKKVLDEKRGEPGQDSTIFDLVILLCFVQLVIVIFFRKESD